MDRTHATLTALRRILRVTELHGREVARSVGMTPVQLRLLKFVCDIPCANAKSLAREMRVSQATVTTLLDKLECRGMVQREISLTDRRQKMISLTKEGYAALENAPDPMQRRFAERFEQLESWEQGMLLASVERISALLDAEDIDAAPILTTGSMVDEVYSDPLKSSRNGRG